MLGVSHSCWINSICISPLLANAIEIVTSQGSPRYEARIGMPRMTKNGPTPRLIQGASASSRSSTM